LRGGVGGDVQDGMKDHEKREKHERRDGDALCGVAGGRVLRVSMKKKE
jgi:hypothetical protein